MLKLAFGWMCYRIFMLWPSPMPNVNENRFYGFVLSWAGYYAYDERRPITRALGWLVSWTLFCAGYVVALLDRSETISLYRTYNWLMLMSVDAQDWGGAGPWRPSQAKDAP